MIKTGPKSQYVQKGPVQRATKLKMDRSKGPLSWQFFFFGLVPFQDFNFPKFVFQDFDFHDFDFSRF
jgi:hypothetical protein